MTVDSQSSKMLDDAGKILLEITSPELWHVNDETSEKPWL